MKTIPDFYHWDTIKDWDKVKDSAPFIIFKGTEGQSFVDHDAKENIKKCEKLGIPYWIYAYLREGSELAQAKFLVNTFKKHVGKMFVGWCLDAEENNLEKNCIQAVKWLRKQGEKVMFYAGYADYGRYKNLRSGLGLNCAYWEARYGKNDGNLSEKYPPHKTADLHQFTDKGSFPGVENKCDLSVLTGREPLEWFTTPKKDFPLPKFPKRGYFRYLDGKVTAKDFGDEIKKQERILKALGYKTDVDGRYLAQNRDCTKDFQKKHGLPVNGCWGKKCNAEFEKLW